MDQGRWRSVALEPHDHVRTRSVEERSWPSGHPRHGGRGLHPHATVSISRMAKPRVRGPDPGGVIMNCKQFPNDPCRHWSSCTKWRTETSGATSDVPCRLATETSKRSAVVS